jgi:hypothetical protein
MRIAVALLGFSVACRDTRSTASSAPVAPAAAPPATAMVPASGAHFSTDVGADSVMTCGGLRCDVVLTTQDVPKACKRPSDGYLPPSFSTSDTQVENSYQCVLVDNPASRLCCARKMVLTDSPKHTIAWTITAYANAAVREEQGRWERTVLPTWAPGKIVDRSSPLAARRDVNFLAKEFAGMLMGRVEPGARPICSDDARLQLSKLIASQL